MIIIRYLSKFQNRLYFRFYIQTHILTREKMDFTKGPKFGFDLSKN